MAQSNTRKADLRRRLMGGELPEDREKRIEASTKLEQATVVTRIDFWEGIYEFLQLEYPALVKMIYPRTFQEVYFTSALGALYALQYPALKTVLELKGSLSEVLSNDGMTIDDDKLQAAYVDPRTIVNPDMTEAQHRQLDDWKKIRLIVMDKVLRDKFRRNDLFDKLRSTGERELVWENEYHDIFWGQVKGSGQNHLGRLLMELRQSLTAETEFDEWLFKCVGLDDDKTKVRPVMRLNEMKADQVVQSHLVDSKKSLQYIGRDPTQVGIVALHQSLSRRHVLMAFLNRGTTKTVLAVMDMNSKSGINGKVLPRCEFHQMNVGDVIQLGASTRTYTFTLDNTSTIQNLSKAKRELEVNLKIEDVEASILDSAKKSENQDCSVFMGGLDESTRRSDIVRFFSSEENLNIIDVRFPGVEKSTSNDAASRGIAFVVFSSLAEARLACTFDGAFLQERRIRVQPMNNKKGSSNKKGKGDKKGAERKGEKKGKGGKETSDRRSAPY